MIDGITTATTIARGDDEISVELDGGVVVMNVLDNEFYDLNVTAAAVWQMLDKPHSIDAVCTSLLERFDVERDVCEREVIRLATDLVGRGVLIAT